ncbi:uncharacterized protein [Trachinotus anak]|uniref:uncharacterized protein n=1 Tax=Trachinotus anak TaxID=443729 RepID=UPI0039F259F1
MLLDVRDLNGGMISQPRTDGSDPDLTLTTRLSMLREFLEGEDEHVRTTRSVCRPQTSAPLPVWRSLLQEEQVTGELTLQKDAPVHLNVSETIDTQSPGPDSGARSDSGSLTPDTCDTINLRPSEGRASNTSVSSPGLPVQPFLKTRDDFFLPSSPYQEARGRRLPCSLPCSPLLRGGHWRSSPSSPTSPSSPSGLSRLWVEAALQRSKNVRQPKPISPLSKPHSPNARMSEGEEGERSSKGETGEGHEEDWCDKEEEEENQVNTVNNDGIRLSNSVIFRLNASPTLCGRQEEEEGDEEDSDLRCLQSVNSSYCLLMPCVCFRCPSAPPYEAEVFLAGDTETVSSFSSEDQGLSEGFTQLSRRTMGDSEQSSLPRERAPQLSASPRLYPSLSLWKITGDIQTELNRKQEINSYDSHSPNKSCSHRNNDDHLQQLISAFPVESCSFCSDKVSIIKHLCRNCDQVLCCQCLSRFISSLQIHQVASAYTTKT